jgi:hypothetical protein
MENELFLIAHKVCGAAAFDVAIQMECPECHRFEPVACLECDNTGVWWIIPTSGHRAYPWWYWNLEHTELNGGGNKNLIEMAGDMPSGWPDHYKSGPAPKLDIKSLFKSATKPTIPRRL